MGAPNFGKVRKYYRLSVYKHRSYDGVYEDREYFETFSACDWQEACSIASEILERRSAGKKRYIILRRCDTSRDRAEDDTHA